MGSRRENEKDFGMLKSWRGKQGPSGLNQSLIFILRAIGDHYGMIIRRVT